MQVIDCLALVTFIGANDLIETEGSLKIIWQVIYPKSGPNVGSVKKPDSAVLSSAISAWSFLLTTISSWRINPDSWKESISFLYNLLEDPDRSVRIAAGEALGLFFELGILDMNFQREDTNIDKLEREISKHGAFHHLQGLKAKILARACDLSTEAGGKGTDKKNLNDQRELFQKFLDFVETGDCPETLLKISRKQRFLTTSTWAQMLQLNFLKGFLGKGFLKHAQDNELLHDIFDFAQDRMGMLSTRKKISKSDDKGWTQKMNKDRKLAQVRKQGHLIPEDD
ncbi:hypothetical protein ZIOFF_027687 [Zingiber officinale]|uniref:Interferon-related developmental regulator N-terminal domain-containing protein n=1 Tax=Zingiber officinale TaxID=94328 RepID=A0A8J5GKA1_ZINOF|nr:hypothetical protein ZIOFF_027687 [Zingiber officinale]